MVVLVVLPVLVEVQHLLVVSEVLFLIHYLIIGHLDILVEMVEEVVERPLVHLHH